MKIERLSIRSLALLVAAIAAGSASPARAGGCFVVLPETIELCTNGARFLVRAFDACGAGATMYAGLWNGSTAQYATTHLFAAQGEVYRYELTYPSAGYFAGDPVTLTVTENPAEQSGSLGASIELLIEDCDLLDPIETTNVWTLVGAVGVLTDTTFDYDGDGTDSDAGGLGSFRLLSTARATPCIDSGVDIDSSGFNECDVSGAAQTFRPKFPCSVSFRAGFYSDEPPADPFDDLVWLDLSGAVNGFSLPYASFGSLFGDWPSAFDEIPREPAESVTGDLGASVFGSGGSLLSFSIAPPIDADEEVTLGFRVGDERDGNRDSGLLLDAVRCETNLVFAAGFEISFLEWDAAVGAVP